MYNMINIFAIHSQTKSSGNNYNTKLTANNFEIFPSYFVYKYDYTCQLTEIDKYPGGYVKLLPNSHFKK